MLLYYITDRKQFPGDEWARQETLLKCVTAAAQAGVDYIQLREKDLAAEALESLARRVMERIRQTGSKTRLFINTDLALAMAVGADGVHLPAGSKNPSLVSERLRNSGVASPAVGVSCHTRDEVIDARASGAAFAVFGPVFEKDKTPGVGVERLQEVCAAVRGWPILALGGITTDNAATCIRAGAAGVAGIRLFQSGDVKRTVETLRRNPEG